MHYRTQESRAVVMARAKRKQWKVSILLAFKNEIEKLRQQRRPRIARKIPRDHEHAIKEMEHITDLEFLRLFRMDRSSFNDLQKSLEDDSCDPCKKISMRTRLAVTIRWLAGGSYLDLCFTWGISKCSFFSERGVLWPTIIALDKILPSLGLPIDNPDALRALSDGFERHSPTRTRSWHSYGLSSSYVQHKKSPPLIPSV